ncbi:hypothetical protein [Nocardia tengchongensis]|uniref:hypothetical protein n=1 Tax=Nocardia tengchongensis TaxID=2055889 RepID=UPI003646EF5A
MPPGRIGLTVLIPSADRPGDPRELGLWVTGTQPVAAILGAISGAVPAELRFGGVEGLRLKVIGQKLWLEPTFADSEVEVITEPEPEYTSRALQLLDDTELQRFIDRFPYLSVA